MKSILTNQGGLEVYDSNILLATIPKGSFVIQPRPNTALPEALIVIVIGTSLIWEFPVETSVDGEVFASLDLLAKKLSSFKRGGGDGSGVTEIDAEGKIVRAKAITQINFSYLPVVGQNFGDASGYYHRGNGSVQPSTTRKRILFPIDPNTKSYVMSGYVQGSNAVALAVFYDENEAYISPNGFEYPVNSGSQTFSRILIAPPSNARFVGSGTLNTRAQIILEERIETEVVTYDQAIFNPLKGKVILTFGDSIMAGDGNLNIGPAELIAESNEMIVYDYAVGGATMAVKTTNTNDIPKRVNDAITNNVPADYIIFDGLTNDISSDSTIMIGEISVGYVATLDTSTFSGAFEHVCRTLKNNWPEAKVAYVWVHKMGSRDTAKQNEFGARAMQLCEKWSIPVVDIFNEGGLNTHLANMSELFTNNADKTHPNNLGYTKFYTPLIIAKLRGL